MQKEPKNARCVETCRTRDTLHPVCRLTILIKKQPDIVHVIANHYNKRKFPEISI
jgi:hypothetical protein